MRYAGLLAGIGLLLAAAGTAGATSYSTSFESPGFTVGPMSPDGTPAQGGWSGGAQVGFTNNTSEPGSVYDENITTADAHTGTQSWLFMRGYDSPGQGTPFSPQLGVTCGQPSSGADYDGFLASFWFKVANPIQDAGSRVMIAGGNPNGNDRSSNYMEIEYVSGGSVTVRSYDGVPGSGWDTTEVLIATGLTSNEWHKIVMEGHFIDGLYNDTWTYTVDDGTPVVGGAYFETARDNFGYGYEPTNRLKFQPRHLDGNADPNVSPYYEGFYFDDISYEAFELQTQVIPEPVTMAGLMLGIGCLARYVRRRRA